MKLFLFDGTTLSQIISRWTFVETLGIFDFSRRSTVGCSFTSGQDVGVLGLKMFIGILEPPPESQRLYLSRTTCEYKFGTLYDYFLKTIKCGP